MVDYVAEHGSASVRYFQEIASGVESLSGPETADIAHFLCVLHGRHPGVVDHAATKTADEAARTWLVEAIEGFTAERAFLTKLTVVAGPISGVGVDDQSNAAVMAQRKALDMLSQSDRNGCAIGASFALVLDWFAIRGILEKMAIRLGFESRAAILPSPEATESLNTILSGNKPIERAINFGADQVLTQHRGLWQLMEARRNARSLAE
ncbi:DUF6975 family protein [Parasphingorhabdus halotolerans]|uniref:Uncharacterized protein n=1 Tax=Parasphingorhabdus halotolerans TaxID=2725558 RepID=A0A6H2DJ60_9SPHN|nr:hypothetical protein [Parasphingorhabdus halotolerans]QJB68177.1 hypothetical protein HF685_01710 [Parasphingorhabdus halotolerans]